MDKQKTDTATNTVKPEGLTGLLTVYTNYTRAAGDVQAKWSAAVEKAWTAYRQTAASVAEKATPAWAEAYSAYLEAQRHLSQAPDKAAVDKVQSAWAALTQIKPEHTKALGDAEQ